MASTDSYQPSYGSQPNSPPSKASLASWWERFKKRNGKDIEKDEPQGIFGVPLQQSINYANVAISLTNADGVSQVYGYVPVVVAKCGVFLKEHATDIEGIFRLSGSAKRIKDLQHIFNSPDKYGKGLDWSGYTVHDAANVLRRYLNQLPEPIIPLEFYTRFRDPLTVPPQHFNVEETIKIYQRLIMELPSLNRQLLLYILDLLAVFASRSEQNRMTATNLAAIFQPGLISHPSHEMAPQAYKLSQDVLVFLINHQDHFLLGMHSENDMHEEPPVPGTPSSLKHSKSTVVRSSSNASAGADDVRKFGGLRRNVSVSSKKSTGSPVSKSSGGVNRSNTLPSRRSPRGYPSIPSFGRRTDRASSPKRSAPALVQTVPEDQEEKRETDVKSAPVDVPKQRESEGPPRESRRPGIIKLNSPPPERTFDPQTVMTPGRERNFSTLFSLAPADPDRPTRKLRKKRLPGSSNHSAESSTISLPQNSHGPVQQNPSLDAVPGSPPTNNNQTESIPIPDANAQSGGAPSTSTSNLMPAMSPTPSATSSVNSQESVPSFSDTTNTSASPDNQKKTKSRWRWSSPRGERIESPGSPTFGGSNGSIAERIRRASRSPPGNTVYGNSDGSGEDDSRSSTKSALSWLKRSRERRDERPGAISPISTRSTAPPSPQSQPPAAAPGGSAVSPIEESISELDQIPPLSTNTSDTTTPRPSVVSPPVDVAESSTPVPSKPPPPAEPQVVADASDTHLEAPAPVPAKGVGQAKAVSSLVKQAEEDMQPHAM